MLGGGGFWHTTGSKVQEKIRPEASRGLAYAPTFKIIVMIHTTDKLQIREHLHIPCFHEHQTSERTQFMYSFIHLFIYLFILVIFFLREHQQLFFKLVGNETFFLGGGGVEGLWLLQRFLKACKWCYVCVLIT